MRSSPSSLFRLVLIRALLRGCPGRRVGEQTLFLEFAMIAWALDVRTAKDPTTGNPVPLNPDRETGYSPVGLL